MEPVHAPDSGSVHSTTVYITNINIRESADDIKRNLYALCTAFGTVLEVLYFKTEKAKSRAFVVFPDHETAQLAKTQLHGTIFMGRPMCAEISTSVSDRLLQSKGRNLKSKYTIQKNV
ncbi:Nucleotide-binding alpha-beta plait [Perkinsela sp. CCAP 1560/4]|nr:ribosomal protein L2 [Perkinsela sp. CCAP 1560/4]KNH07926.1 Nucleotide-binding alpha-beta plait [Perkinsela sp. CCAP 1560/4]|eukprot:KNH05420.1 ribosomal protein L2 [Perkinsela sp. CCAP 1560/4]